MYETMIADRDKNISSLEGKLVEVTAANDVYNREIASLQTSMVSLRTKCEEFKSRGENNIAVLSEKDQEIEKLKGKLNNLVHGLRLKTDIVTGSKMQRTEKYFSTI